MFAGGKQGDYGYIHARTMPEGADWNRSSPNSADELGVPYSFVGKAHLLEDRASVLLVL